MKKQDLSVVGEFEERIRATAESVSSEHRQHDDPLVLRGLLRSDEPSPDPEEMIRRVVSWVISLKRAQDGRLENLEKEMKKSG